MEQVPSDTGPLSPDFMGIDPEAMDRFTGELEQARAVLEENLAAIRQVLASNGVSALPLEPLREVEQWIGERLPELRRRGRMAEEMAWLPGWTPGGAGGLVPYDESAVPSSAEARRLGRALGERYRALNPNPFGTADPVADHRAIVTELAAHAGDGEFTAAFFAALGYDATLGLRAQWMRVFQLPHSREGEADAAMALVGRAFGAAVGGGTDVPGFAALMAAVHQPAHDDDERRRIGALLSTGRFPADWLAGKVAGQILAPDSGVPGRDLTGYLDALANNPSAARLALTRLTKGGPAGPATPGGADGRPDLAGLLVELSERVTVPSAGPFGRMLAAASGAYDELDGAHSDAAARVAFTLMTTADDMRLIAAERVHLAEVAGSYASEIAEGADLGDDNQLLPSAYGPVDSRITGLTPMFRLSPKDTYRFIQTFALRAEDLLPFETGMGALVQRLTGKAVPIMRATADTTRLDAAFAAFGNVRGLELAAAEKLRAAADDADKAANDATSQMVGLATGFSALELPGKLATALIWEGLNGAYSKIDPFDSDGPTRVDRLHDSDAAQTLARRHAVATTLIDAGFPPKVPPSTYQTTHPAAIPIADQTGALRPFADIAAHGDKGLRAFEGWLIANGLGSKDKGALGEVINNLANRFEGQKSSAIPRARLFEN
jgi:hypothetical protein